jgi:serine/threonine-protein kinase
LAEQRRAHPYLEEDLLRIASALAEPTGFARELSQKLSEALDPRTPISGERVGVYEIDRPLGWGGMGAVYLAHRSDAQYEMTVAVKMLPEHVDDDFDRQLFLQERQTLARLDHPAIARLIDGGVSKRGQPYFVLEYVEGRTVEAFCDAEDLARTLSIFESICQAVAHAHARLIIH